MPYPFRSEYFECDCHSLDHTLRITFDPTEDDIRCLDMWVDCAFPSRTLWQRIVIATKYVLGRGSQDWTYGSWILKHEDEKRLKAFFREYDLAIYNLQQKSKKVLEGDNATQEDSL